MTTPRDIVGMDTTTTNKNNTRPRSNTYSYPRWDANGNSHHPPPDRGASVSASSGRGNGNGNGNGSTSSASSSTPMAASPSASTPSSILRLLGLSPKSNAPTLPPISTTAENTTDARKQGQHRRGASYGTSSSSTYSSSMTSPFYEDDEEDDRDSPPEAVTPPQHHAHHAHLPLSSMQATSSTDYDNHHISHSYKQGRSTSTTSTTTAGNTRSSSNTTTLRGTDFGSELDTAHKLELDSEDVFESDHHRIRSPPSASSAALYGAPLGRRASWSPAMATTGGNGAQYGGGSGNASTNASTNGGVLHWINGQQQHTTYPVSASAHANNNSHNSAASVNQKDQTPDYGSSPIGLFRRLSLSTNRRPQFPPAPPSTISQVSENDERIGRPVTKVASAPPRRLSPMGERMLRAHYDSFS